MFKTLFQFEGRIRRTEYVLTLLVSSILRSIIALVAYFNRSYEIVSLLLIPLFWVIIAQGVKRCHDLNKRGWYQVIPLYVLVLIFNPGEVGENGYGTDPKVTS